jgi:N-acyl-D-amino-acid deacylase
VRGAALAVTRNGKLVHARGYGFANLAKKQPVEPASLFHIASMSKPLTAVGVMTRRSAKVNITG